MPRDLRAAAQAALRAPRFRQLFGLMPREDRNSPRAMLAWLDAAAEFDPKGAQSADFERAHARLTELAAAQQLYDRASALYWDPKIRAEFGAEAVERAWRDPSAATKEALLKGGPLSAEGHRVLDILVDAERFSSELGEAEHDEAAQPAAVPSEAAQPKDEYAALVDKSVGGGQLTPADTRRFNELHEARLAREEARPEAAKPSAPKDEYTELAAKPAGGQTQAETNRLNELYQARLAAAEAATPSRGAPR